MSHPVQSPDGWKNAWLQRDSFDTYAVALPFTLSVLVCIVAFISVVQQWRISRKLKQETSRAEIRQQLKKLDRKSAVLTKANFFLAIIYMLHVVGIILVDGYISILAIKNDATENPEEWTASFCVALGFFALYTLAMDLLALFGLPFLQLLLAYRLLSRRARTRSESSLSSHIPGLRFGSSQLAVGFAMLGFAVSVCWSPVTEYPALRWALLEGALGSTCMWMEASYVFNFRAESLQERTVDVEAKGTLDIVAALCNGLRVAHAPGPQGLPTYEDGEKDPLLVQAAEKN